MTLKCLLILYTDSRIKSKFLPKAWVIFLKKLEIKEELKDSGEFDTFRPKNCYSKSTRLLFDLRQVPKDQCLPLENYISTAFPQKCCLLRLDIIICMKMLKLCKINMEDLAILTINLGMTFTFTWQCQVNHIYKYVKALWVLAVM